MNGFKHTGAADGANAGDYATYNQAAILANANVFPSGTQTFQNSSATDYTSILGGAVTIHQAASWGTLALQKDGVGTWAFNVDNSTLHFTMHFNALANALDLDAFGNVNFLGTIKSNGSLVMIASNNLADLTNVPGARANLGVTATGADTTYAYRANNLSDLANAGTARTNLGLHNMATVTYTSSTGTPTGTPADGDLWFQHA
jgi:hypothetical protein